MYLRIFYLSALICATGAVFNFHNFDRVNLKFYHGRTDSRIFTEFYLSNITQVLTHKAFDHNRPTVVYIFGWLQNTAADTTRQLIDAYVKRGDYNFLVLDWANYNVDLYTIVMFRMCKMSRVVGRSFLKLFNKGLNVNKFHCVGHSFGAHSCGIIGREVQESSNGKFKLSRITGLDPAKWRFFPPVYENPLSPKDAQFVDTIQTDNFMVGAIVPLGHVSFYPNNAAPQPGCPGFRIDSFYNFLSSWCSHFNANRYWTETLNKDRSHYFPATKCSNWNDFKNGQCNQNSVNYMGLNATADKPGVYYLELKTKWQYNNEEFYYFILSRIGERVVDVIVNELGIRF